MSILSWFKKPRPASVERNRPAVRVPMMEGLEDRALFSAAPSSFAGVTINGGFSPAKAIPILKKLHVKQVRIFFGMNSWDNRGGNSAIAQAQKYHAAGFKVMMEVGSASVPSYAKAVSFMKYLASRKDAKAAVDLWEIGNEPNRPPFWHGSASQYVNTVLKAAWNVLHKAGEKVVGAGPTFELPYAKQLVDAGYLKYVDYANFHPYGHSVEQVLYNMNMSKKVYKGKPVIFSEWNVRSATSTSDWIKKLNGIEAKGSRIAAYAFYFTLVKTTTLAGPSGLVTKGGGDNQGFARMYQHWFE